MPTKDIKLQTTENTAIATNQIEFITLKGILIID